MKAFISVVLGVDSGDVGALGKVKAYYGCVEAQGRGMLHCHMLVWLEGGLNPNEIKDQILQKGDQEFCDRLLAFLDDTISTCVPKPSEIQPEVPSSRSHPSSVCSIQDLYTKDIPNQQAIEADLQNLISKSQIHKHSGTCYKYWKSPEPRTCREKSSFDPDTGELCLQCLDGMVNHFNETIIRVVRCNMDIQFIGSGASAKAVLYYITDYITKSRLKANVVYAALELSVRKLGEYDPQEDDITVRAKRLLQKCSYAMMTKQELSGQEVATHAFRPMFWTSLEHVIDVMDPVSQVQCD
ncbi:uncharacterized protein EV420DRAFT_1621675 [Desarmillaria tabescens]|uniref:Helitron helicase-like domain-containing protein n=1 Tax=Armillaria tabescens TaxID=1929756 RepID=A0AA39K1J9_ARMTA|nr:uncharacterized protein EV420DRAFT_1621675 [Desarmillaria tabescens]KAK0452804.1 hypothetical protein EV420DRAFT_1621675 [Desarmillaria tabescens]